MAYKNISFLAHQEDISFVSQQLLLRTISRFNATNRELYENIDQGFKEENIIDILGALNGIIENCSGYCQELENIVPILNQADDLLPPDTEVIEDLPDLLEDSSGVDGGGE
jgi:hypothetical protein|tara:strand:+ start:841 stop:1173 length:333 start_codon:yes stop_codon:yes gene_type:complete